MIGLRMQTQVNLWDKLSLGLLLVFAVLILGSFCDYGYSWDETWQNRWYGQSVIRFIVSLGEDITATNTENFYLYGGTFDALTEALVSASPLEPRNTRHLANALTGFAGLLGCGAVARYLGGSISGFWAILFLAVSAPWYGHMFINAKDIPFATGMIWSIYFLLRTLDEFPRPSLKTQLLLGSAVGLTLGVRIGGVLVLFYLLVLILISLWIFWVRTQGNLNELRSDGLKMLSAFLTVSGLAWLLMLAFWPAALLQPLTIPLQAIRAANHFQWVGTLLWNGREVWSNNLPWNYLLIMYAVQLPEILTLLFACALIWGGFACYRLRRDSECSLKAAGLALLLFASIFPALWAIITGATIYDNGRQFLFLLPPLACLGALCWSEILTWASKRKRLYCGLLAVAMICALLLPVSKLVSLHPYQYAYLNAFAGGMPEGASRFDTEYWISSYREASFALVDHAKAVAKALGTPFSELRFSVAVIGPPESLAEALPDNFVLSSFQPGIRNHYLVATTRWNADREWPEGQTIAEVGRLGMRFAVVKADPALVRLVKQPQGGR